MKITKKPVSRVMAVPGQPDVERKTTVAFRDAENTNELLELSGNDLATALKFFNDGRWAALRTKVSNALANKTPEQRAVDKMIDAFKLINPTLTDEAVRAMVLSMPNMQAALTTALAAIPAETDESYFDKAEVAEAEAAVAPEIAEVSA